MTNDGGPAFARSYFENSNGTEYSVAQDGMSLRDYFAGQFLSGIMSSPNVTDWAGPFKKDYELDAGIAKKAYQIADAMLAARGTK